MDRNQSWFLVAVAGSLEGREFPLTTQRMTVGREDGNGLVLRDDNVSRRHLELHVQDGKVILCDLGSRNGTFINNQRITGTITLERGDRLALGSHLLEVQGGHAAASAFEAHAHNPQPGDEDKTVVHRGGSSPWLGPKTNDDPPTPHKSPADLEREYRPRPKLPPEEAHLIWESTEKLPDNAPSEAPAAAEEMPSAFDGLMGEQNAPAAPVFEPEPAYDPPAHGGADFEEATVIHPGPINTQELLAQELEDEAQALGHDTPVQTSQKRAPSGAKSPRNTPIEAKKAQSGRKPMLLMGGGLIIVLALVMGWVVNNGSATGTKESAKAPSNAVAQKNRSAAAKKGDGGNDSLSALLSGEGSTSLIVGAQAYTLDEAETKLTKEERKSLAQDVFDQAASYAESDKHKEALREFNHALALDGTCDLCMIRANKVAQQIRQRIEKFNGDGLRYFQSQRYDEAYKSWERALLLLDDPQSPAGMEIQSKMAEARQQHARQSYR